MDPHLSHLTAAFILWNAAICTCQSPANDHPQSSQLFLNRTRRYLVFANSGTFKPWNFMDKRPFRQLTMAYSIHVQFGLPTVPLYWWSYFTNSSAWAPSESAFNPAQSRNHKPTYDHNPHLRHYGTFVQKNYKQPAITYDYSRSFVYKALEVLLTGKGIPGMRCVLRAICEVAQRRSMGRSFIEKIIKAVLRPTVANIDSKYLHAKKRGMTESNCEKVYWGCNKVLKWLKQLELYF